MNAELFYDRVTAGAALPPPERHRAFADLHAEVVQGYVEALRRITTATAHQLVKGVDDSRSLGQIVGHIAAWEQFSILAAGDILAGVRQPRTVTTVTGFVGADGQILNFTGIDAFNDYHAARQATLGWEEIRIVAVDTARALYTLFTHPRLLSADRLEATEPYQKRLQNGAVIADMTMGWSLWLTVLEHEAVEHAEALQL